MSRYRRSLAVGGTFFFTVTLADRGSRLPVEHINRLRRAYGITQSRHPFHTIAVCVLPDHLHAIWRLPDGDADFGRRWGFHQASDFCWFRCGGQSLAKQTRQARKSIWQRCVRCVWLHCRSAALLPHPCVP